MRSLVASFYATFFIVLLLLCSVESSERYISFDKLDSIISENVFSPLPESHKRGPPGF